MFIRKEQMQEINNNIKNLQEKIDKLLTPPKPKTRKTYSISFSDGRTTKEIVGYDIYYNDYVTIIYNEDNQVVARFFNAMGMVVMQ